MAASADIDACGLPEGATMSTLTLRLPEDVANRLKDVAGARGISVNKLITEISVQAIAVYDAEARFRAMAAMGNNPAALAVLDRLDEYPA